MPHREADDHVDVLVGRLGDARSRQVIFLSHCLLNENTRYLGGACRRGCVREVVDQCLDQGIGIVQMPCPEQEAWGGVLKTRMLRIYGGNAAHPWLRRLEGTLVPIAVDYTRRIYRRLARRVARQVEDYLGAGFTVVGVVAIDGSPSCGLLETVDIARSVRAMASLDPHAVSVEQQNTLVRRNMTAGPGIFIDELRHALASRRLDVPFLAHDLVGELDGRPSAVKITAP